MIRAIAILYTILALAFLLFCLLTWFRQRRVVRPYRQYGFLFGAAAVAMGVMEVASIPGSLAFATESLCIALAIAFLRNAAYAIAGIYFSAGVGHSGFPLLMRRYGGAPPLAEPHARPPDGSASPDIPGLDAPAGTTPSTGAAASVGAIAAQPAFESAITIRPSFDTSRFWTATGAVIAASVGYTVILFAATSPHISRDLQDALGGSASAGSFTLLTLLVLVEAAVAEELQFRLGFQNFIAKFAGLGGPRYGIAIAATAALWTAGHVGQLDPEWVKLAQIFPVGLALGWLYQRFGAESCMIAHIGINVLGALLAPRLLV